MEAPPISIRLSGLAPPRSTGFLACGVGSLTDLLPVCRQPSDELIFTALQFPIGSPIVVAVFVGLCKLLPQAQRTTTSFETGITVLDCNASNFPHKDKVADMPDPVGPAAHPQTAESSCIDSSLVNIGVGGSSLKLIYYCCRNCPCSPGVGAFGHKQRCSHCSRIGRATEQRIGVGANGAFIRSGHATNELLGFLFVVFVFVQQ